MATKKTIDLLGLFECLILEKYLYNKYDATKFTTGREKITS